MTSIARDLAVAMDPASIYVLNGMTPDDWQLRAMRSQARQQLWCNSRQVGKSSTAAAITIHHCLVRPRALVILAAPAQKQSQELGRKVLEMHHGVRDHLPVASETQTQITFQNGARVVVLSGSEVSGRGYSACSLLILDEASRIDDALIAALLPAQATVGDARFLALSTPAGRDNWFARAWFSGRDFARFKVTASECSRITQEFLDSRREELGDAMYRQEFECDFDVGQGEQAFNTSRVMEVIRQDVSVLWP